MPVVASGANAVLPKGIAIGHASDKEAATGCTAILCKEGAVGSVAVRGGAPATRETDLLAPQNLIESVHAVVLSGGSAFGLDAASGVMRFLEEKGVGLPFKGATVPLVVGASLFDLDVVTAKVRPTADMGYAAAAAAQERVLETGALGAGTGASVGRFMGSSHAMKGGLGVASVELDGLVVSAVVAVNSLGSVYDQEKARYIAGAYIKNEESPAGFTLVDPLDTLAQLLKNQDDAGAERSNTTIGAVLTNACITKTEALRVASMAHDGMARAIYPIHTSFDGDALFTLATGEVETSADLVGALGALVVERAIIDAVLSAKEAYGLPCASLVQ